MAHTIRKVQEAIAREGVGKEEKKEEGEEGGRRED